MKTMLVTLLIISSLLYAAPIAAQHGLDPLWFITRGGVNSDESWWADVDSEGSIYWATHQTYPGPLADIVLYKLAPDGSEIWSRRWGDFWNEQAYMVVVEEPYVYVGGTKWTGIWLNSCDMALVCWTTAGDSVWSFTWDGGYGYEELDGLVVDGDTIYAAGWTTGETTGNDLAILKLDREGHLIDSRIWGTANWDEANGQIVVDGQYVYVAGRYDAPTELSGGDAVLAAFDKHTLEYAWHRTWGGDGVDDAYGMIGDGTDLYVVGLTLSFGGSHIFLLKYDRDGQLLWDDLWGGTGAESSRSLAVTDEGDILVAGKTTAYGAGEHDIVLLRYTPGDSLLWFQTWGGPEIETAHGIVVDGPHAYIAGETYSFGQGKNDALLIKATIDGRFPATAVTEQILPTHLPGPCLLGQNYPNPCNSGVIIPFTLTRRTVVSLTVFDILGRQVAHLLEDELAPGQHEIFFQAQDLSSGVYLYRLQAEGISQTKKLVILR